MTVYWAAGIWTSGFVVAGAAFGRLLLHTLRAQGHSTSLAARFKIAQDLVQQADSLVMVAIGIGVGVAAVAFPGQPYLVVGLLVFPWVKAFQGIAMNILHDRAIDALDDERHDA